MKALVSRLLESTINKPNGFKYQLAPLHGGGRRGRRGGGVSSAIAVESPPPTSNDAGGEVSSGGGSNPPPGVGVATTPPGLVMEGGYDVKAGRRKLDPGLKAPPVSNFSNLMNIKLLSI